MAITKATSLADFGSGIGTDGSILKVDQTNSRIGIGTSNPTSTLTVRGNVNVIGIATFSGNVTVGGTVTYMDVTNVDSVGIITAQQGIQILSNGINVTGVSTLGSVTATGVNVTGVVTATSFSGSGANLTNLSIPAGFTELDAALFS